MIEELIASCSELSKVSSEASEAYASATDRLLEHVNRRLENNPQIKELIGRNPLDLMRDNHRNHATLMATVFRIRSIDLLVRTVPWLYRAYRARGFSYDYFPAEFVAWQSAIDECLEHPAQKAEITAVYEWMVQHHSDLINLSLGEEELSFSVQREPNEMQQVFLTLLLNGDSQGCLNLVAQSILTVDDLKHFYLEVVWPAMTRIGQLWESNQVSVAEEHLATAIVGRVMAALYPRFAQYTVTKGRAVVSAGPNDFHETGARMVADFMEIDGWDVTYLGANIQAHEILDILKRDKPFIVAVSVATVFNLENARKMIQMINDNEEARNIKIVVGGFAFNSSPQLWQTFGADGFAADAESALSLFNEMWMAKNA